MVKALFDTNILIDFLDAVPQAGEELARYDERAISVITWMEVMIGAEAGVELQTRSFLDTFTIVPLGNQVAERAVAPRRKHRVKLPDVVDWASADIHSMLLVTRNTRDLRQTRRVSAFPTCCSGCRATEACRRCDCGKK